MKGKSITYNEEEASFLRIYCHLPRKELTAKFNEKFNRSLTVGNIAGKCKREKWLRPKETWRFKKGNIPFNKGTKGVSKPNKTSFKKGNKPATTLPVGSIRYCSKDNIYLIKVSEPDRWVSRAEYVWCKQHNSNIPKGCVVWHKNGDPTDDRIENLAIKTRLEVLLLNRLKHRKTPDELKGYIVLIAQIKAKAISLMKHNTEPLI